MAHPERDESNVFRKHYSDLREAVQTADRLAIHLYSAGLISKEARRDIEETPKQTDKNEKLLAAVERAVSADPSKLEVFLSILEREEYLHSLVERIRANLSKCLYKVSYSIWSRELCRQPLPFHPKP